MENETDIRKHVGGGLVDRGWTATATSLNDGLRDNNGDAFEETNSSNGHK